MMFEELSRHVEELGGLKQVAGFSRIDRHAQGRLAEIISAPLAESLAWWWAQFGGGLMFVNPVVYSDPRDKEDVVLGWLMGLDEIRGKLDAFAGSLAPHRIPFANDGADNLLVVDSDGSVWEHIHDAPLDVNTYRVADSFEAFVHSLRVGE